MSFLELQQVSVGFGAGGARVEVLRDVNLAVEQNEFIAIIGFSGSGKSTLLSTLAGLITPDRGQVLLHGRSGVPPGPARGMVFQNYSLLPWLTVRGNIELAVRQVFGWMKRAARRDYVQQYIDLVKLSGSERKFPGELSGGMRQRLALARTLSMRPDVLLLDEPLSALDALTRANLQDELVRIWEEDRRTVVMITNDVDEAVLLADRIIPLTPGPAATLGREYIVDLPRPRDRTSLNFDPRFKTLRNDVTKYLLDLNRRAQHGRHSTRTVPPDLLPIDVNTPHRRPRSAALPAIRPLSAREHVG